jgi:catechol 2,3-dioxygenase-like lactoylglutathione lyase family enzyme
MIHALQHVGLGTNDVVSTWKFYKEQLGFRFEMGEEEYPVWELKPMFGREPRMRIHNSFNPRGGPTLELFEHRDTPPREPPGPAGWADLGLLELGIEVEDLDGYIERSRGTKVQINGNPSELRVDSRERWRRVRFAGPEGVWIELLERQSGDPSLPRSRRRASTLGAFVRGISHVAIGVSDLGRSEAFWALLGFDRKILEESLDPRSAAPVHAFLGEMTTSWLGRSRGSGERLSSLDGGMIKLVHCRGGRRRNVFEGRRFGDPGITEVALDASDVWGEFERLTASGARPLVPPVKFDWGFGPSGTLAYLADPDGVVIELVDLARMFWLSPRWLDRLVLRPARFLSRRGLI